MESLDTTLEKARGVMSRIGMVANDPGMVEVVHGIAAAALAPVEVLVQGPTGSGKELVVKAIAELAENRNNKVISINCSLFEGSETIESILFGHVKGAFTGAAMNKPGVFEDAENGFVFLDEVHNMPLRQQNKLLRVLQEKSGSRLGSTKEIDYNFRLISATNLNLEEEIACGDFKDDLYHRINCITINVPPLCKRKTDIVPIALEVLYSVTKSFIEESGENVLPPMIRDKILARDISVFNEGLIQAFSNYRWPGNVRELSNEIRSCLALLTFTGEPGMVCLDARHFSSKLQDTPRGTYVPRPIPTSGIALPASFNSVIERLAQHNHDLWSQQRISEGWKYGPVRDDVEKTNPCLIEYDALPEAEKDVDRTGVIGMFKALYKLGVVNDLLDDFEGIFEPEGLRLKTAMARFEAKLISQALDMSANNQSKAASMLGTNRISLRDRIYSDDPEMSDILARYRKKK
jgi:DNA-binding NtrC family response regulator